MKFKSIFTALLVSLSLFIPATASAACSPFKVAQGGTGTCSLTSGLVLFGNGTSAVATSSVFSYSSTLTRLSVPYASSTAQNISGSLWLTSLGTAAGAILAVDPDGKVIATTTSASGVTSVTGTYPVISSGGATPDISLAFGTTTANDWSALNTFTRATSTLFTAGTSWFTSNLGAVLSTSAGGLLQNTTVSSPLSFSGSTLSCPTCNTSSATVTSITGGTGLSGGTITTSGTFALLSYLSTSSAETSGRVPFWTTTASTPASLSGGNSAFTFSTTGGTLLTVTNASTTNLSAGTSLFIPNSTSQTPTAVGQLAQDTTDNQLKLGTGGSTAVFDRRRFLTFSYATTTAWTGTTTLSLGTAPTGITFTVAQCYTDTGTLNVQLKYNASTNVTPMLLASSTAGVQTTTANNTPAATNKVSVDVGTPATSPTQISCSVTATVTGT